MSWKRTVFNICFGVFLTVVLAGALILGRNDRKEIRCLKVQITIEDSASVRFVTGKAVRGYLQTDYKGLVGMPLDSIDLHRVEDILDSKSAILSSEAYVTRDGVLNVRITQREPLVRFQAADYGFYADADGYLFPLQESFTSNIHIVDGKIPLDTADCRNGRPADAGKRKWLDNVVELVKYLNGSPVWKDRIVQIACRENGELVMVPESGRERFIFGDPDLIEDKFEKMELYYKRIAVGKEDVDYDHVDLRFSGQIVCKETERK